MSRHDRAYGVWTTKTFRVHRRHAPQFTQDHSRPNGTQSDKADRRVSSTFADDVKRYLRNRNRTLKDVNSMGRNDGNNPKPNQPKPQQRKPRGPRPSK